MSKQEIEKQENTKHEKVSDFEETGPDEVCKFCMERHRMGVSDFEESWARVDKFKEKFERVFLIKIFKGTPIRPEEGAERVNFGYDVAVACANDAKIKEIDRLILEMRFLIENSELPGHFQRGVRNALDECIDSLPKVQSCF